MVSSLELSNWCRKPPSSSSSRWYGCSLASLAKDVLLLHFARMVSFVNNIHTQERGYVCVCVYTLAMVPLIFAGERKLGMQEREAREREQPVYAQDSSNGLLQECAPKKRGLGGFVVCHSCFREREWVVLGYSTTCMYPICDMCHSFDLRLLELKNLLTRVSVPNACHMHA